MKLTMQESSASRVEFLSLPNEIIIEVIELLDKQRDIHSVILVNKRLYDLFKDYLYRYNIKYRRSFALLWAAMHGRESTARKLLHLGANPSTKTRLRGIIGARPIPKLTPLHCAAGKGQLAIVKLLLEVGAKADLNAPQELSPLFFALIGRHEKVARTLSRHIEDPQSCLVDSTRKLTPLHISSHLGLPGSTQFFLDTGAVVDALDDNGLTPLHHALQHNLYGRSSDPSPDEVFKTVKVLLDNGADQNLEMRPRQKPISARKYGAMHPDHQIRALFSSHSTPAPAPKHLPRHVGRTWNLSPEQISLTHFIDPGYSLKTLTGEPEQPSDLNPDSFPALSSTDQAHITGLSSRNCDTPWSASNAQSLIAGLQAVSPPTPSPITTPAGESEPFPRLDGLNVKHRSNDQAEKAWADFRKPKYYPEAGETRSDINTASPKERKSAKSRGKAKWEPLKL